MKARFIWFIKKGDLISKKNSKSNS